MNSFHMCGTLGTRDGDIQNIFTSYSALQIEQRECFFSIEVPTGYFQKQ